MPDYKKFAMSTEKPVSENEEMNTDPHTENMQPAADGNSPTDAAAPEQTDPTSAENRPNENRAEPAPDIAEAFVEEAKASEDLGQNTDTADAATDIAAAFVEEAAENEAVAKDAEETMPAKPETSPYEHMSLNELFEQMEKIINRDDAHSKNKEFHALKDAANHKMRAETEALQQQSVESAEESTLDIGEHPKHHTLTGLTGLYRQKMDAHQQQVEEQQQQHKQQRQDIIEKLRNLYTNTEPGTNLFKAIREIKEEWKNAGQVAKSEFKILNNNYFHHLNQFYQMLDLNKEYMEQEFAHNLEKRRQIIDRAKELETEPSVQKALNELQYLHRLWKEEAEPVAEEFRETTWEEFREISNRIHDRKGELNKQIEEEQQENLTKKSGIIEEIKKLTETATGGNHSQWQNAIRRVEELRTEFLQLGNVPRKLSSQTWTDFKQYLRAFNAGKNEFYKTLKNSQQSNLEQKQNLVQIARENMNSEDWETAVPLFKKLQEDWKKIGHVPRSMTNQVWNDFREACNTFFNAYREKNNASGDNWKQNYKVKKQLLEDLRSITDEEGSVEKIEEIKNTWNKTGKVPREKIGINSEFNKLLREKLKLNKVSEYSLNEKNLTEDQLSDKARKMKNQIADLEAEVVKMENNLGFFSDDSRDNPLLAHTYARIDEKKKQLEDLKNSLHQILSAEKE